jgi:thiol-disulfide isomerase/thioredoxin
VKRILIAMALTVLCACSTAPRAQQHLPDAPVTTLDGNTISLQSYRGHPLWINFFATWCPPCIAEIPEITRLQAKYKRDGLVILGVDRQEAAGVVSQFVAKHKLDYAVVLDNGTAAEALHVGTLPVSLFVAADGTVQVVRQGEMTAAQMQDNIEHIIGSQTADAPIDGQFALQGGTQQTEGHLRGNALWLTSETSAAPIRHYQLDMTKYMHVVIVSGDLRTFQHVHPVLQPDGVFKFTEPLPEEAAYLYADSIPENAGQQVFRFALNSPPRTMARDLSTTANVATAGPYTVRLSGSLSSGAESHLTVKIYKNGQPANDLHPYLGAPAHAVFINARDLSYVHVHPMPIGKDAEMSMMGDMDMSDMPALPPYTRVSPDMLLHVRITEPGTYKLWLQFRAGQTLRVAAFVLKAE